MSTPISGSTPTTYATIADLTLFKDQRRVADLVADNDTRPSSLTGNAVAQAALDASAGRVEMAVFAGGRYAAADLTALTGVGARVLAKLVCDLAFGSLQLRRFPERAADEEYKEALELLKELRSGVAIFGLLEVQQAANVETVDISVNNGNSPPQISQVARPFFGNHGIRPGFNR